MIIIIPVVYMLLLHIQLEIKELFLFLYSIIISMIYYYVLFLVKPHILSKMITVFKIYICWTSNKSL